MSRSSNQIYATFLREFWRISNSAKQALSAFACYITWSTILCTPKYLCSSTLAQQETHLFCLFPGWPRRHFSGIHGTGEFWWDFVRGVAPDESLRQKLILFFCRYKRVFSTIFRHKMYIENYGKSLETPHASPTAVGDPALGAYNSSSPFPARCTHTNVRRYTRRFRAGQRLRGPDDRQAHTVPGKEEPDGHR